MRTPGIYELDEADAELSLLPMAARRALDSAALHLSLKGWQMLSVAERRELIQLGAHEVVDDGQVRGVLADPGLQAELRAQPAPAMAMDMDTQPPPELLHALPEGERISPARWTQLSALDRYVLCQLARRGKRERLARALSEICGMGGR